MITQGNFSLEFLQRRWRRRANALERRGAETALGFYCCPLAVGSKYLKDCPVHGEYLDADIERNYYAELNKGHGLKEVGFHVRSYKTPPVGTC